MSTALIIGASRGLGLEFTRQYRADGWRVLATVRSDAARERVQALGAKALALDVTVDDDVARLDAALEDTPLDLALHVVGIMTHASAQQPPSRADFDAVMHTNVLGAMQLIPRVAPRVERAHGIFAFLSTGMSLIARVDASNAWLYRVSKAALNMAMASARHAWPQATFVALDPGWVRTDLGGPQAPLTPTQSVADLRATLARVQPADNGRFLHRDGRAEPSW